MMQFGLIVAHIPMLITDAFVLISTVLMELKNPPRKRYIKEAALYHAGDLTHERFFWGSFSSFFDF